MFSLSWPPVQDTELEQAQAGVSSPLVMTSTPLIMLAKASSSTGSPGRSPIRFMGAGSSELLEFSASNLHLRRSPTQPSLEPCKRTGKKIMVRQQQQMLLVKIISHRRRSIRRFSL